MNGTIVEPVACGRRATNGRAMDCWENELSIALRGVLSERVTEQLWRLVV